MVLIYDTVHDVSTEPMAHAWYDRSSYCGGFSGAVEPVCCPHHRPEFLHAVVPADKASTSDDENDEKTGKVDDGAESAGVTGTDAAMTDAGQTPEPGTTPEPEEKDNKGDALAALLAAGETARASAAYCSHQLQQHCHAFMGCSGSCKADAAGSLNNSQQTQQLIHLLVTVLNP